MKRIALTATLLLVVGCGNRNLNGLNSVTLHNNTGHDIYEFSVTRNVTKGANVLPQAVKPDGTFKVNDLQDGEYALSCEWQPDSSHTDGRDVNQTLEGGKNFDWYPGVATKTCPSIVEKVLRWFLQPLS